MRLALASSVSLLCLAPAGAEEIRKAFPRTTEELAERRRGVLKETKTPGMGVALALNPAPRTFRWRPGTRLSCFGLIGLRTRA
ncbi:MAG TPA: hypothetical protein VGB87_01545 [Vicinamibacteria bacterium]